jgi:hypothetical protein
MTGPWTTPESVAQAVRIARSHRHWLGRDLLPGVSDPQALAAALATAPFVLVSHGTESDPILNYGNRTALTLWELSWPEFTRTPSRLTAEPVAREERARLLEEVTRNGYIANYAGVRISSTGRRFRIHQALVWNLLNEDGAYAGQAAMFERWDFLDGLPDPRPGRHPEPLSARP